MRKKSVSLYSINLGFLVILASALNLNLNLDNKLDIGQQLFDDFLAKKRAIQYTLSAVSENRPVPQSRNATDDNAYAQELDSLGVTLHIETDDSQSLETQRSLNHCKSVVYQTLNSLPSDHTENLKTLKFRFDENERRGYGGGSTIILRCVKISDPVLASVLVHEIGHTVDTGKFTGSFLSGKSEFKDGKLTVYNDDLSLKFYRISWLNDKTLKSDSGVTDFVSEYAMTDPFEDFAESYNYYILHGEQFRYLAQTNDALAQKYKFLKKYIFDNKEWDFGQDEVDIFDRNYDSTVLAYDLDEFFES